MIARHPKTGDPIRILKIEPQISTSQKSCVWVRATFEASPRWSRYYTIVSEVEAVAKVSELTAIVLPADAPIEAWLPLLPKHLGADSPCLLFAPMSVLDALGARGWSSDRALSFEDLYDGYPYLGEPVKPTDSLEKVIVSVAHILRMNRILWTSSIDRDTFSFGLKAQADAWIRHCKGSFQQLEVDATDACIPKTWLIQQFFRHITPRRNKELKTCLHKNLACPFIDHVVLLNEQDYSELPTNPKLSVRRLEHRITYLDVLEAVRTLPSGDFVIFSNADIYCDETLQTLWQIPLAAHRLCLALLRWEDTGVAGVSPTIFGPRADSQDTWILARDSIDFTPTEEEFGFPFGKPGCDNAIGIALMRKRCAVVNPAYTIKTYHVHTSNLRSYDPQDILYKSHYLYVEPTAIQPFEVVRSLKEAGTAPEDVKKAWSRGIGSSFARPILGANEAGIRTICTMLRQTGTQWNFSYESANLWTPPPRAEPLYHFKGGHFVTADGLVSSFQSLLIGDHPLWVSGWQAARQSSLMSSLHVPHMMALPCDDVCGSSLSQWVLRYLPRALRLRTVLKDCGLPVPEFLVPKLDDMGGFLHDCSWKAGEITVIPHMKDMNYYSEDVWAVPPESDHSLVTSEDVALLRTLLPPLHAVSKTGPQGPCMVFCVEDDVNAVCTRGWAEEVADKILPRGWKVHYVSATDTATVRRKAFGAATWLVGSGTALDWIWYARKGTTVMEFLSDSAPNGDHIHLAGAADLRYIVGVVKKEPVVFQRQTALLDVGRAVRAHGFRDMLDIIHEQHSQKPNIVLPSGAGLEGLWAHRGDGFREMVSLWQERGYVTVEARDDTGYCWWGSIGEIMLYDRPTPRWWADPPPYQMALFGNCLPAGPSAHSVRQSIWCHWPRSPRTVESVVGRKEPMKSYEERSFGSVFLGRVENGIQHDHRTKVDWSSATDLFSMPTQTAGEAYPYSQEEYLITLCKSRFGLCLPGFGAKNNREIECFATGCVPIIVDGVDVKGYLVQPREGVHYFRAKTPADVKRIVAETSVAQWTLMSLAGRAWWYNYASAEGLFRLTWARIEQCRPYFNVGIPKTF